MKSGDVSAWTEFFAEPTFYTVLRRDSSFASFSFPFLLVLHFVSFLLSFVCFASFRFNSHSLLVHFNANKMKKHNIFASKRKECRFGFVSFHFETKTKTHPTPPVIPLIPLLAFSIASLWSDIERRLTIFAFYSVIFFKVFWDLRQTHYS